MVKTLVALFVGFTFVFGSAQLMHGQDQTGPTNSAPQTLIGESGVISERYESPKVIASSRDPLKPMIPLRSDDYELFAQTTNCRNKAGADRERCNDNLQRFDELMRQNNVQIGPVVCLVRCDHFTLHKDAQAARQIIRSATDSHKLENVSAVKSKK